MTGAASTQVVNEERTTGGLRVLVALDESPQSQRVLPYAHALARTTGGQLKLLYAKPSNTPTDYIERALERIARPARESGVATDWQVVEGRAEQAILGAARSWPADIIAVASTKWSGFDRWLNDSVADAVVRSAVVPVLVVPPDWEPPAQQEPKHLLVPLDGSPLSEQALVPAGRLAPPLGAELILLRVGDSADHQDQPPGEPLPGAAGVEAYLQQRAADLRAALPGQQVSTQVVAGAPADAIARVARELNVDLIVMSTRGRGGLARAVFGSTATATVEHSSVPLLLLGPHALGEPSAAQIGIGAPVRSRDA